jgi:hypothetical protein
MLPSRGKLLLHMINPLAPKHLPRAPGVATVLLRSQMVGRELLADTLSADDLLISPATT